MDEVLDKLWLMHKLGHLKEYNKYYKNLTDFGTTTYRRQDKICSVNLTACLKKSTYSREFNKNHSLMYIILKTSLLVSSKME